MESKFKEEELLSIIDKLWIILDKIDDYADCKINGSATDEYFAHIEDLTKQRHKYVQSDGYHLYINDIKID